MLASLQKLDVRVQLRNPVMFAVYLGSMLTTVLWLHSVWDPAGESSAFVFCVAVWLWFTVLLPISRRRSRKGMARRRPLRCGAHAHR